MEVLVGILKNYKTKQWVWSGYDWYICLQNTGQEMHRAIAKQENRWKWKKLSLDGSVKILFLSTHWKTEGNREGLTSLEYMLKNFLLKVVFCT